MARFRSRATRSAPRKKVWARTAETVAIAASSAEFADALADFETAYGADLLGATVIRIRGQIVHDQSVTMGMRVFADSTLANLTASDGPRDSANADWFLYRNSFVETSAERHVIDIDNKSARKMEELGQGLLLGFSNLSGSVNNLSWDLSILLMLP